MALMVVHGLLHLLGWDHENDADANRMESRERELLGRANPVIARTAASELGGGEKASRGASLFTASNPEFGATFTYYLPEPIQSGRDARREAEKEKEKENEPNKDSIPGQEKEKENEPKKSISPGQIKKAAQGAEATSRKPSGRSFPPSTTTSAPSIDTVTGS